MEKDVNAIPAGNRLIWLVVGTSLAALGVLAFSELSSDLSQAFDAWPKVLALCSIGWLILLFFVWRRRQWARWLAVALLAFIGFLLLAVPLGDFLDSIAMGQQLEWNASLLVGLTFVFDAVVLVFPDSVGDFFAVPESMNWSPAIGGGVIVDTGTGSFQPDALLESLPQREIMARRARHITAIAIALSWMMCAGAVGWKAHKRALAFQGWHKQNRAAYRAVEESEKKDPSDMMWVGENFAEGVAQLDRSTDMVAFVVLGYLILFVFPFLFTMPFVLPFALSWHDPVRFLILRPFNKEHITTGLARFLRKEFSPFGHCYTLSDRNVRVPLHVRIPLFLGQLSFFNFRARKIRRPLHIEKVALGMQERVRRNVNWCFSRTKLFPISCCDPGWRACVVRLVSEVDVIVADLSSITEGIVWELELLRDTGALTKTVFVVEESRATTALEGIAKVMGPYRAIPVLPYGEGVASSQGVARSSIMQILRGGATSGGALCH